MTRQDSSSRGSLAVLGAAVLWGTTGTVAHHAPAGSRQALVGLATFGFGALVLLVLDARGVARLLRDRTSWPLLLVGALGVAAYAGCYYWSMALVGVAIGNVLALGSGPVFAAVLELLVERTRVSGAWLVSTLVSVLGIVLLGLSAGSAPGSSPVAGVLLALAAGLGYAVYSWAGARLIGRRHPSRAVMASIFTVAACGLLPALVIAGAGPLASVRGMLVIGYLALVPMALAYLLFGHGLRHLPASTATTLALAEPVVATILATTVLHEHLALIGWVGLLLVGAGIVLLAVAEARGRD